MTIKSKNANDEALPPLCDAPPLRPDEDRPSAGPRKMLNEKRVLVIVPFSRATLFRMEKAGTFLAERTSARTGKFGTKTKL